MNKNITEKMVLQLLNDYHDLPFTVESLAAELETDRQSVAPYITTLLNDGILVSLMSAIFVRRKDGRAASRPVNTLALTCYSLKADTKDLLYATYQRTYQSLLDRISHPSIIPGGMRFESGWFGIMDNYVWIDRPRV